MVRFCTGVSMTRTGWIPSMRVWKIVAYDGTTVVCPGSAVRRWLRASGVGAASGHTTSPVDDTLAGEKVVALIEEDCGSNDIKFRKFCQLVTSRGYQLTEDQVSADASPVHEQEPGRGIIWRCGGQTGCVVRGPHRGAGLMCAGSSLAYAAPRSPSPRCRICARL